MRAVHFLRDREAARVDALVGALAYGGDVAGVLPAAMAWVGALIIDAVVAATRIAQDSGEIQMTRIFTLVAIEAVIVAALSGAARKWLASLKSSGSRFSASLLSPSSSSSAGSPAQRSEKLE